RAHDDLRDLLDEAVALRMRSDVSSGYLISGGLDSSSVLASAARAEHEEPIRAYTLRYDDERDESAMASAIVDHINRTAKGEGPGISLDYIEPSGRDLGAALDGLLDIQGEPFADGSMLAHYELMRAVSAEGHKVVVGGLGGDEALAGYIGPCSRALAADQIMAGHWRAATRTVGGGLRGLLSCLPHVPSVSIRNPLRRTVQSRLLRGWLRPGIMGHLHERYPPEGDAGRFHSYLRAGLRQWSLPGFTHYEDRNAMHFGLEARAPLLDFRIVEWGLAQGPEQLIEDGLGKMPLRRCMTGRLPDDVLWYRKKRGLPAPADVWMSENAAWVDEALSEAGVLEEWIDTGAVRRDFASAVGVGKPLSEVLGGARTDVLWRIVMAARWSDRFRVSA
ncbi:MAG: asparagine synthetase B family protein, partial [Gammaproteobacteria bacterium]